MKILVDANIFTRKQKTGVDYYTLGLVLAAARAMPQDQFVLAHFGGGVINVPSDIKNVQIKRIWLLPSKVYGLYRHYLKFLPLELFMPVQADAMFFPDFSCPVTIQKVPKLAVIHDLVYLLQPEYVPVGHQNFLKAVVSQALEQATQLVVNSESTSHDIQQAYGYSSSKINVIPPAVDTGLYYPAGRDEIAAAKKKYGISGDYILFLSTLEPRKNVVGVLRAYQQLPSKLQDKYQLVLAGKKGWDDEELEALCEELGDRVVRAGRVDSVDKAALYSGSAVFATPSFYEGFSMPILEAMACGTPVVTGNVSSMPEVADDAALIVDPHDVEAITQALQNVLSDPKLARQLRESGAARAKQFSWEKSGQQLANLLRSLVKS